MNHGGEREARVCGGVGNRGVATIGIPTEDFVGHTQAAYCFHTFGELYARGRHLEDVRSAGRVWHILLPEKARERLTVLAVADEAEARGR